MLQGCHAYIVAQTAAQNRSLVKLASRAGFSTVGTVLGTDSAPLDHDGEHLSFFLLHHQLGETVMRAIITAIRHSPNDAVRFAPVVLIINDCPFETILKFIEFGYDDVITLPERREVLVSRLSNQLNSDHLYFETDGYLGPDRRRMELLSSAVSDERRTGHHPHTKYTIRRTAEKPIQILRTELIGFGYDAPIRRNGAPRIMPGHSELLA
jgi:hypothetical protein